MAMATALLVVPGDDMGYAIPYKTYDYMAVGRPIIALCGADTALHNFVERTGIGVHVEPSAHEELLASIESVLNKSVWTAPADVIAAHSWSRLALSMAEILSRVLREHPSRI